MIEQVTIWKRRNDRTFGVCILHREEGVSSKEGSGGLSAPPEEGRVKESLVRVTRTARSLLEALEVVEGEHCGGISGSGQVMSLYWQEKFEQERRSKEDAARRSAEVQKNLGQIAKHWKEQFLRLSGYLQTGAEVARSVEAKIHPSDEQKAAVTL